ncbi:MAG: hypothetical protein ABSD44_04925 [Terracidiphilus sp.]
MTLESSNVSSAVPENTAIARCMNAWKTAYRAVIANGKSSCFAVREAAPAYRNAMPPLTEQENIGNFVACVARGMLIGAIEGKDGTRLLYAAQVALATVRRQPSPPKAA